MTKSDGDKYYKLILVYVEYLLVISQDAVSAIREVADKLKLKKDKIEPNEIYLIGQLLRKELNGNKVWTIRSVDYVK